MSPELQVMMAPRRGYAALRSTDHPSTWAGALARIGRAWVVLGASLTMAATGHISAPSLLPTLAWWVVVPLCQLLIALAILASGRPPGLTWARALDLFFVAAGPWSLWYVLFATWAAFILRPDASWMALYGSVLMPAVWTAIVLAAYFREVFGLDAPAARRRVVIHQVLTWGVVFTLAGAAVQVWPRLLEWLGR